MDAQAIASHLRTLYENETFADTVIVMTTAAPAVEEDVSSTGDLQSLEQASVKDVMPLPVCRDPFSRPLGTVAPAGHALEQAPSLAVPAVSDPIIHVSRQKIVRKIHCHRAVLTQAGYFRSLLQNGEFLRKLTRDAEALHSRTTDSTLQFTVASSSPYSGSVVNQASPPNTSSAISTVSSFQTGSEGDNANEQSVGGGSFSTPPATATASISLSSTAARPAVLSLRSPPPSRPSAAAANAANAGAQEAGTLELVIELDEDGEEKERIAGATSTSGRTRSPTSLVLSSPHYLTAVPAPGVALLPPYLQSWLALWDRRRIDRERKKAKERESHAETTGAAIHMLVDYLYGVPLLCTVPSVKPLLVVSSFFDVPNLANDVSDYVYSNLSVKTAVYFLSLVWSQDYGEPGRLIEDASLAFVYRNSEAVTAEGGPLAFHELPLALQKRILTAPELYAKNEYERYRLALDAYRKRKAMIHADYTPALLSLPMPISFDSAGKPVLCAIGDRGAGGPHRGDQAEAGTLTVFPSHQHMRTEQQHHHHQHRNAHNDQPYAHSHLHQRIHPARPTSALGSIDRSPPERQTAGASPERPRSPPPLWTTSTSSSNYSIDEHGNAHIHPSDRHSSNALEVPAATAWPSAALSQSGAGVNTRTNAADSGRRVPAPASGSTGSSYHDTGMIIAGRHSEASHGAVVVGTNTAAGAGAGIWMAPYSVSRPSPTASHVSSIGTDKDEPDRGEESGSASPLHTDLTGMLTPTTPAFDGTVALAFGDELERPLLHSEDFLFDAADGTGTTDIGERAALFAAAPNPAPEREGHQTQHRPRPTERRGRRRPPVVAPSTPPPIPLLSNLEYGGAAEGATPAAQTAISGLGTRRLLTISDANNGYRRIGAHASASGTTAASLESTANASVGSESAAGVASTSSGAGAGMAAALGQSIGLEIGFTMRLGQFAPSNMSFVSPHTYTNYRVTGGVDGASMLQTTAPSFRGAAMADGNPLVQGSLAQSTQAASHTAEGNSGSSSDHRDRHTGQRVQVRFGRRPTYPSDRQIGAPASSSSENSSESSTPASPEVANGLPLPASARSSSHSSHGTAEVANLSNGSLGDRLLDGEAVTYDPARTGNHRQLRFFGSTTYRQSTDSIRDASSDHLDDRMEDEASHDQMQSIQDNDSIGVDPISFYQENGSKNTSTAPFGPSYHALADGCPSPGHSDQSKHLDSNVREAGRRRQRNPLRSPSSGLLIAPRRSERLSNTEQQEDPLLRAAKARADADAKAAAAAAIEAVKHDAERRLQELRSREHETLLELDEAFEDVWKSVRFMHMTEEQLALIAADGVIPSSTIEEAKAEKRRIILKLHVANKWDVLRLTDLSSVEASDPEALAVKDIKWPPFRFGVQVPSVFTDVYAPAPGDAVTTTSERIEFAGSLWCLDLKRYSTAPTDGQATGVNGSTEFVAVYLRRRPLRVATPPLLTTLAAVTNPAAPLIPLLRHPRAMQNVRTAVSDGAVSEESTGGEQTTATAVTDLVDLPAGPFVDQRNRTTLGFSIRLCGSPGSVTSNSICGRSQQGKSFGIESESSWGWESFLAGSTVTERSTWNTLHHGDKLRFVVTLDML